MEFNDLFEIVVAGLNVTEGVKMAVSPDKLGMKAAAGTIIIVCDDGSTYRATFKNVTPKDSSES